MNNEITGPIIGCGAYLFCALCSIGLGIYAINSKKPMNFWAGDKIPPEKINDLKKYNRANGIMWIIYGLLWLPGCVITFFNDLLAGMICGGLCIIGLPVLIYIYIGVIKKKYFIKEE